MTTSSRDHLLGYLLGALEPTEQEQIEAELELNPQLRAELDRLGGCVGRLGLNDAPPDFEPPAGLAARTCRFVATQSAAALTPAPASAARRFRWADLAALAAVLVIGVSLIFPALWNSRIDAQITNCQNNLRLIGEALHDFSDRQPDGAFPAVEESGPRAAAGVYAPTLVSHQQVPARVFLCPSVTRQGAEFRVPTLAELDRAQGQKLTAMQRTMGGDYGYTLGYMQDGKLQKPRNAQRSAFVLLSDAPSDTQPNRASANHFGKGQNYLYEDGHTAFWPEIAGGLADDPFHNREGRVAAGLDCDDAVLGASADPPLPVTLISNGR